MGGTCCSRSAGRHSATTAANTLISRIGPGGQQFAEDGLVIHAVVPGGSGDVIVDLIGYLAPL